MGKDDILSALREFKSQFARRYGIIALGMFGSFVRGEANENSDVDVVVRLRKPELFMIVGIKSELEERLHRHVDIVTYRESMNRFLKKKIDNEAEYV